MPWPDASASWQPPEGVVRHDGKPLGPDLVFFQPPPPEIGRILTAHSSVLASRRPSSARRVLAAAMIATPPLFLAAFVYWYDHTLSDVSIGALAISATLFVVAFVLSRPAPLCSYVGTEGVAVYEIGPQKKSPALFLFRDAAHLYFRKTPYSFHGYIATGYQLLWLNSLGAPAFVLKGYYSSEKNTPPGISSFWLALSAERAWTHSKLAWLKEQLEEHGCVVFSARPNRRVYVGPGFLVVEEKKNTVRLEQDQIKEIEFENDSFDITAKGAKFFGLKGLHHFAYSAMADAQLFRFALETLIQPIKIDDPPADE